MKPHLSTGIIITLLLTNLGMNKGVNAPAMAQSVNFDCTPVGQMIRAGDHVQRRRSKWGKFSTTSQGAILCAGDRLRIDDNSSAEVQCLANNTTVQVPSKVDWLIDEYCPVPNNKIPSSEGPFLRPRGSSGQLNIVSPRNTSILTQRPTFYWNSVEGASYYEVQLEGYQMNWKASKIKATQLAYPPTEPALQYENTYSLMITAYSNQSPEKIAQQRVSFSLPSQVTIELVHQRKQEIQKSFEGEAQALVLATFYQQYNLNAEAIQLLENLQKQGFTTADIALRLAQLYVRVQHYQLALNYYQQAFQLAETSNNLGVQVEAAQQIGQIYTVMDNSTESEYWLAIATNIDRKLKQE